MKYNNILETIGNTPHVRINRLFRKDIEVWMKVERFNPGGSIKDRIGVAMIEAAEKEGKINHDTIIIEPTSGNTGIGLSQAAAVKGYRLILTMPESMSVERRKYMKALGAEIVLTPKELGMGGAIEKATEIAKETANSWIPQQFNNPVNSDIHRQTTAQEILSDFPEGLDYMITGVGTGGHITGCAEVLSKAFPSMQTFAVEPESAGFIPKVLNTDILSGTISVDEESSFEMTRACAQKEGIFVGISSGATLAALRKKQDEIPAGSRVLIFSYDTGERYLSIEDLF